MFAVCIHESKVQCLDLQSTFFTTIYVRFIAWDCFNSNQCCFRQKWRSRSRLKRISTRRVPSTFQSPSVPRFSSSACQTWPTSIPCINILWSGSSGFSWTVSQTPIAPVWLIRFLLNRSDYQKSCTSADTVEERIKNINEYNTFSLYSNVCRSLFERHKLMFAFLLCVSSRQTENVLPCNVALGLHVGIILVSSFFIYYHAFYQIEMRYYKNYGTVKSKEGVLVKSFDQTRCLAELSWFNVFKF